MVTPESLSPFESIRRLDENGAEYWSSRDLARVLEYTNYRNFEKVIEKAKIAATNSGQRVGDHIVEANDMVQLGSGAERQVRSVFLSRYACYLIVQNADPSKSIVALGQTYFALQSRRQELEDDRRLTLREEMKTHNKNLASAAKQAGVIQPIDYAIFQNSGYKGLYGGLSVTDIKARKKLKKSEDILDHMGSEELAANLFRATQTEAKLKREGIVGKDKANQTHFQVGEKVRETIRELGGTMPEKLPKPDKSIKALKSEKRKALPQEE